MEYILPADVWWPTPKYTFASSILGLLIMICLLYLRRKKYSNLPPGPRGIPFLGYLPFLSIKEPHFQLDRMRKKYGNVFGMNMGCKYTLFLCDIQSTREAFNKDEFCARPEGSYELSKSVSHFVSLSGQRWKDQRRIVVKTLRPLGLASNIIQDLSRSQAGIAVDLLEKEVSSKGAEVNIRLSIECATTGIALNNICGKTFPPDHEVYNKIHRYLDFFMKNGVAISPDTFLPWIKPILTRIVMRRIETKRIFSEVEKFFWSEVESRESNQTESEESATEESTNIIDALIKERNKPDGHKKLSRTEINGNAQILLVAATDTTRLSIEWFVLCMAQFTEVQERVFREINDLLGPTGKVSYEDREKMPFTEAAIFESMRYRTLLPINALHSASADTDFNGYTIPKDTVIFSVFWSIHHDPKNWSHPDQFYPKHFLTPDETSVKIPDAFLPFSLGKRACLGEKIALVELFIFTVSILQRFKILPPEGGVNLEGNIRATMDAVSPIVKLLPRYP